jgi:ABC-type transport system involved in cytochrome c biogenesis permease subunit
MKRFFPWLVLLLAAFWIASNCRMPKPARGGFDLTTFGKIPVLAGGRAKPLDTVARNSLVIIRGRQTVRLEKGETLSAIQWFADMVFKADAANKYPVFVINNPDVLGMFGWRQTDRKFFSYAELDPFIGKIDEQGQKAGAVESSKRTPFQSAIFNLRNAVSLYQHTQVTLQPDDAHDFPAELDNYLKLLPEGREMLKAQQAGTSPDHAKHADFLKFAQRYERLSTMTSTLAVPPLKTSGTKSSEWTSVGESLLASIFTGEIHPVVKNYAKAGAAWQAGDAQLFNQQAHGIAAWMAATEPNAAHRCAYEFFFNHFAPFYLSMSLYVLAFLFVAAFWVSGNRMLARSAYFILLLTLVVHTFGLASRMYLQGRPPVTNLYSSAIFIGWGTVIIGLILERIYRDGIGSACAALIGFVTLIIAHHLAASGDTLEMLQAVLDTNIWLATHVVTITIGYSAMFFAGLLAIFYVVRGFFTRTLTKESAHSLTRMTYGVICFATLFSFVGTVLGGIWADQSWGRFWGWDPKENGALLIVLWCALILHARWGGYIRQRGLMMMVLFGNVITAFSWFGVNMLGVGLHSYGFMDKAFPWLAGFVASQLALIAIAGTPLAKWKSFHQAQA